MSIPQAPVYRPTRIEFADPLLYIQSIRAEAQRFGICKIIPPDDWKPPPSFDVKNMRFTTRKQRIDLLQCRDMDAAKVEFLTRLVVFWQQSWHRRLSSASAGAAGAAAATAVSPPPPPQIDSDQFDSESELVSPTATRQPGKRRSESELLADPRRRPNTPGVARHAMEVAESSSAVRALRSHAAHQAQACRAAREVRGTKRATIHASLPTKETTRLRSSHRAAAPVDTPLIAADDEDGAGGDHNNFTFRGVTLSDGEVVPPTISDVEVDLFLLFELVSQRFGGFSLIAKRDWTDLVRLMRATDALMEAQQQFRPNLIDEETNETSDGYPRAPAKHSPAKARRSHTESPAQLAREADSMRDIYRTYLLPYEEYVQQHTHIDTDRVSSASADSPASPHGRSHHSELPLADLSMDEIRRWPHITAMKQKETALAAAAASTNQHAAAAAAVSVSDTPAASASAAVTDPPLTCAQCETDSLAPTTQCYQCRTTYHWSCLSPPLSAAPLLPWYCPDCAVGGNFGFPDGEMYDLARFEQRASAFKHAWFARHDKKYTNTQCPYHVTSKSNGRSPSKLTAATKLPTGPCICDIPESVVRAHYWRIVERGDHTHPVSVEYGSDLDTIELGSGFPTAGLYARSGWNLNNLPTASRSILKHLTNISGVTSPWLYVGMCFSSFCWHAEDHYTYSINYVHQGAPKQWYGVPSHAATSFETVARRTLPHLFSKQPDLMFQMVTMIAPTLLHQKGVPVYAMTQNAGEFILTLPQAYHGGFNHGVNIAEAVNFAPADWLPFAIRSVERYRSFKRTPVFSTDLLLLSLARDRTLDVYASAWLARCLRHMRDEEVVMREHLRAAGLTRARRWTNQLHVDLFGEDHSGEEVMPLKYIRGKAKNKYQSRKVASTNQCVHCRHAVHISAVWCACRPNQLACLRHAAHLCACGFATQTLLMRYHVDELDRLVSHVEQSLSSVDADHRAFDRSSLQQESDDDEYPEGIDDADAECAQCLEDTEVASFAADSPPPSNLSPLPSFAESPKPPEGAQQGHAKQAHAQTQGLHRNYLFLEQSKKEHAKSLEDATLLTLAAHTNSTDAPSATIAAALEHVHSAIYPIPIVPTPSTRHVIPAPSLVRKETARRAEQWLRTVKPFLLASFALKRAHRQQERERKRADGMDTDSSDDDDHDDDDDNEADGTTDPGVPVGTIEPVQFNGPPIDGTAVTDPDEDAEEELLDRELRRALRHKVFAQPLPRGRGATLASAAAAVVVSRARLTLPQLEDLVAEGATLVWATVHSREVNLVMHRLNDWLRLVSKIQVMAATRPSNECDLPAQEEVETVRRLISLSAYVPLDLIKAGASARGGADSTWRSHLAVLQDEVGRTERMETEIQQLLDITIDAPSLTARDAHPALRTYEQMVELQERVNALPLTFPAAQRLVHFHLRLSASLRRACAILGQPQMAPLTAEQIMRFSSTYRPWEQVVTDTDASRADDTLGDLDSAESCLSKLMSLPLRHSVIAHLQQAIDAVLQLGARARRLLYLSPAHGVARDRDAFADESSLLAADRVRELGPQLTMGQLRDLNRELHESTVKPRGVIRRLEKMMKDIDQWQKDARVYVTDAARSVVRSHQQRLHTARVTADASETAPLADSEYDTHRSLDAALIDLTEEYDGLGVSDIPMSSQFQCLRQIASFESTFLSLCITPLANAMSSTYFDFRTFQPRVWLDLLDRVFAKMHPVRDEWQRAAWEQVLAEDIREPTNKDDNTNAMKEDTAVKQEVAAIHSSESVPSETNLSSTRVTPSKRAVPDTATRTPMTSHDADGDVDMTSSSRAIHVTSDGDDDRDESKDSSDIRRSSRTSKRRRGDGDDASSHTSTPIKVEPGEQKHTDHATPVHSMTHSQAATQSISKSSSDRTAPAWRLYQLLQRGRALLAPNQTADADGDGNEPSPLRACVEVVRTRVAQLEDLFRLMARLRQHISHLHHLKDHVELMRTSSVDAESEERRRASRAYMHASATCFTSCSSSLSCPYYSAPSRCPFYTIPEVEKLYVLSKAFETSIGAPLSHASTRMLKQIYTQAYLFQMCASRLVRTPSLAANDLALITPSAFTKVLEKHNANRRQAEQRRETPPNRLDLLDWSHPYWRSVMRVVDLRPEYDLNLPVWHALLSGEVIIGRSDTWAAESTTVTAPLRMRHEGGSMWMPTRSHPPLALHHALLIHPHTHASYQDLAARYNELIKWAARAMRCIAHLRECLVWSQSYDGTSLKRPSLSRASQGALQARVLTPADQLVAEATEMEFECALLRKLRHALWLVRVLDKLTSDATIDQLYAELKSEEAWRAGGTRTKSDNAHETDGKKTQVAKESTPTTVSSATPSVPLGAVAPVPPPSIPPPVPTFTVPTVPIISSTELEVALAASPTNEFNDSPWPQRLVSAIRDWHQWVARADQIDAAIDDIQGARSEGSDTATTITDAKNIHCDEVVALVRAAPRCAPNSSQDQKLKRLRSRLETAQAWAARIRAWITQGEKVHQQKSHAGSMTNASLAPTPSPSVESVRISMTSVSKLVGAGRSVRLVTAELELLISFQRLNAQWSAKLDALFQPRHEKLQLRQLLKSMLVPLTAEKDKEKVAAIVETIKATAATKNAAEQAKAGQRHPVPDSNGLYCICKSSHDDRSFMITCDTCACWYHGSCVNVSMSSAQQLTSFSCPKCCLKATNPAKQVYPFGNVQFRHARPTIVRQDARETQKRLLSWLDTSLSSLCPHAHELVVLEHVRSLRAVLGQVDAFIAHVKPWLQVIEEENTAARKITATTATATATATAEGCHPLPVASPVAATAAAPIAFPSLSPPSLLFTSSSQLAHLKGCIRQGKKIGINFPELATLKRRYDQARNKSSKAPSAATASPATRGAGEATAPTPHEKSTLLVDDAAASTAAGTTADHTIPAAALSAPTSSSLAPLADAAPSNAAGGDATAVTGPTPTASASELRETIEIE